MPHRFQPISADLDLPSAEELALEAGLAEIARDETVTFAELRSELAERRAAAG